MHVPRGISRHVVRFVDVAGEVFAVKEATDRFVVREHQLLRSLAEHSVPVVDAFGTVVERVSNSGEPLGGLLITRHLPFSQPYRSLFTGRSLPGLRTRLLDALAGLFVRLHLAGFYWGDCSLSNALFRRDAGALAAYLVDAETGDLHSRLSDGQRAHDLDIATENIAGEMFDLQAAGLLDESLDVVETAQTLWPRYQGLWDELTLDVLVPHDEHYRINAQLRRLNKLGFDVSE
ncbi:MAG: Lipopolysaccharide kinase (Kdo/WaaP) family protein, partial [Jatrophihabitans sp.]|nr:Lipopolysaccharide kinase (Kdo/WaaP) family protein [Jatrophihabitans sp.]